MRLRPLDGDRRPRLPGRRRLKSIQVLPTLITACNLLAGTLALSYLVDAAGVADLVAREGLLLKAAWLIFLGMFCDALDGRIARLTRTTSAFGAQLDSLADVVTFGVAPALLAKAVLGLAFPALAGRLLFGLCLVYVTGAALRLARYNVESARADEGAGAHVTRIFRGLPSPAAAGVIAALVVLHGEQGLRWADAGWLAALMLALTPLLGLLMISRMPYSHLLNRYFDGSQPLLRILVLIATAFLGVAYFEWTVAGLFLAYAASGPLLTLIERWSGWPEWVEREEEDEEVLAAAEGAEDAEPEGPDGAPAQDPDEAPGPRRQGAQ